MQAVDPRGAEERRCGSDGESGSKGTVEQRSGSAGEQGSRGEGVKEKTRGGVV